MRLCWMRPSWMRALALLLDLALRSSCCCDGGALWLMLALRAGAHAGTALVLALLLLALLALALLLAFALLLALATHAALTLALLLALLALALLLALLALLLDLALYSRCARSTDCAPRAHAAAGCPRCCWLPTLLLAAHAAAG